jgi:hypothetical protein
VPKFGLGRGRRARKPGEPQRKYKPSIFKRFVEVLPKPILDNHLCKFPLNSSVTALPTGGIPPAAPHQEDLKMPACWGRLEEGGDDSFPLAHGGQLCKPPDPPGLSNELSLVSPTLILPITEGGEPPVLSSGLRSCSGFSSTYTKALSSSSQLPTEARKQKTGDSKRKRAPGWHSQSFGLPSVTPAGYWYCKVCTAENEVKCSLCNICSACPTRKAVSLAISNNSDLVAQECGVKLHPFYLGRKRTDKRNNKLQGLQQAELLTVSESNKRNSTYVTELCGLDQVLPSSWKLQATILSLFIIAPKLVDNKLQTIVFKRSLLLDTPSTIREMVGPSTSSAVAPVSCTWLEGLMFVLTFFLGVKGLGTSYGIHVPSLLSILMKQSIIFRD